MYDYKTPIKMWKEKKKKLNGKNQSTILQNNNVNYINFPIESHKLTECIKVQNPIICCI